MSRSSFLSDRSRSGRHGHGAGRDRRTICRYQARYKAAILSWTESGQPISVPARLEDVSMNGCRLKIHHRRFPRPDGAVVLQIQCDDYDDSISGVLLAADKVFLGPRTCRIRFVNALCFQTFKLLAYGPKDQEADRPELPEYEMDTLWR